MLNVQAPEKPLRRPGEIEVQSLFSTIQGEGPFCGTPCVFIRLAGCNLACPACDTDYTSKRRSFPAEWIAVEANALARSQRSEPGLVVITGGEPFRQDLSLLVSKLLDQGHYVQIETNGTLPPRLPKGCYVSKNPATRSGVYIVVSPKTGRVHPECEALACAYKYVLAHDSIDPKDGLPLRALDHPAAPRVARPTKSIPVYLQPCDDKDNVINKLNTASVIDSCMNHGYTLQLQIHKILDLE